ncbi:hypothetical protein [Ornithinibacillus halotolerans]|uniref:Bacterial spore germination immunoglobulin-like domain-containing protein n=1 Tax=Ornithinibacillus halotolerans TaxID=1274357 RepID=A0A916W7D5_9BACI|nr:hypothetical protein [Ornithinibacillus halotolerans]GGA73861.1 hypothetical protein GCM10008025_16960 [Ornithinibacillus halotolerans]
MLKKLIILLCSVIFVLTACGNEQDTEKTNDKGISSPEASLNIQDLDVKIVEDKAVLEGKAKASNNEFYYHVEKEDHILKEEESVQVDGEWGTFEITIDITEDMKESEEVVFVKFFNRDNDSIVNPNYVPLDIPRN